MKFFKYTLLICILALGFVACGNDDEPVIPPVEELLEVNPDNIAGKWNLVSLNGAAINGDDLFFRITLRVEGLRFSISENMQSSFAKESSGVFSLSASDDNRIFISGVYDFSFGETWSHDYHVSALTSESMRWSADGEVMLFERIKEQPAIYVD